MDSFSTQFWYVGVLDCICLIYIFYFWRMIYPDDEATNHKNIMILHGQPIKENKDYDR